MSGRLQQAPTRQDRAFHIEKPDAEERLFRNAVSCNRIIDDDRTLITTFVNELRASGNLSQSRATKIVSVLIHWRRFIGPYRTNDLNNLYNGIAKLKAAKFNGHPYKQNTLRDNIMFLKRFYRWLAENQISTVPPGKIAKIKAPSCDMMTKTASDLLTEAEVLAMIRACQNSRDRALISVLYEGGFRIMELGTLSWNQVKFDEYGAVINVNLKTEKPRYVRLVSSVPSLATWKQDYPYEPEGDALVFLTAQHNPLEYEGVNVQLKKIARRAGITKKVTPHIFRHSRVTHLHQQGCHESVLKMMMWGHQGTKMMQVYSHLTGNDIDNEVLRLHGVQRPQQVEEHVLKPIQCRNCRTINGPDTKYCGQCGLPLTDDEERSMNQIVHEIERHPLYISLIDEMKKKVTEIHAATN